MGWTERWEGTYILLHIKQITKEAENFCVSDRNPPVYYMVTGKIMESKKEGIYDTYS